MLKHQSLISSMTLEEKIRLTSGKDNWRTVEMKHLGIPKITLSDGPHGLRHQEEDQDHLGINESNPSTCFPLASLTAASFDEDLLYEMGRAIGYEALCQDVQVVLGPGVNIKRNPLCGRNFEYFSEDPCLSAKLGTAWIRGVQSMGVGASLKHFAMNNQESNRMKSDSLVDRKAMHDIYLKSFEGPVKEGKPYTVMGSYNLIDGIYACEHPYLLNDVLREKFGFEGVLVTDWSAMNDKKASFMAGLDLEMPGGAVYFDEEVREAILTGKMEEKYLDQSVDRILDLVFRTRNSREKMLAEYGPLDKNSVDREKHHELSRRIARESMVLLKNELGILPLEKESMHRLIITGALAEKPRYQGAGSSHINPYKVTSLRDGLDEKGIKYTFFQGYSLMDEEQEEGLEEEILSVIEEDDIVLVAAGLPDEYESEGFDREHMRLPTQQNELILQLTKKSRKVIVLLYSGAPVEMPWADEVAAILNCYLPGQAGGEAAADLLFGEFSPCGKLPETLPHRYEDHVTSEIYGIENYQVEYREGIYVGYRYFDKAGKQVRFPFGHGLSYTEFQYEELSLSQYEIRMDKEEEVTVSFRLRNIGEREGKEISQLYIERMDQEGYVVKKSLKGFKKTSLRPGEEKIIEIKLQTEDFCEYDLKLEKEVLYEGRYMIHIGSSSQELRLTGEIKSRGIHLDKAEVPQYYARLDGKPSRSAFEALKGIRIRKTEIGKPFTVNNTLYEMKDALQMRIVMKIMKRMLADATGVKSEKDNAYKVVYSMFMHTPIKRLSLVSPDKMPKYLGESIVHIANGEFLKAAKKARDKK
ncbi:beta-glucosidase family protein [Proteiniclasticum sp. C24MP]|uniref:beta-glucosidase n=1 Tax=Proteiniclasticum sp. C24MP TaxID=3374101 RepID=UPI003754CB5F